LLDTVRSFFLACAEYTFFVFLAEIFDWLRRELVERLIDLEFLLPRLCCRLFFFELCKLPYMASDPLTLFLMEMLVFLDCREPDEKQPAPPLMYCLLWFERRLCDFGSSYWRVT
jgi:hypothetical protein